MAKDFGKLNKKKIEAVAKKSNESANVITVKMIGNDNLLDYPKNNEDISMTEDLELSMKQNGFTDPIEVTSFGCEDGKYMIVSGHRRRAAGVKVGYSTFPCIIKTFKSDNDVFNYVLLANSQRDSAKDPLLFCKRYKMHEECLKESNFEGNIREEIAKRLGLSVQQADRYNQMNKIILTVWDMVREEKVGMSSVLSMSKFFPEHQEEIVNIFNECMEQGQRLSREVCKLIIDGYKAGKKSYFEIISADVKEDNNSSFESKAVLGSFINTEPTETKEEKIINRNDEINYDISHREGLNSNSESYSDEKLTKEDYEVIDKASEKKEENKVNSDVEKLKNRAVTINNSLDKLEVLLENHYSFNDEKEALELMHKMKNMIGTLVEGMQYISWKYETSLKPKYDKLLEEVLEFIEDYK